MRLELTVDEYQGLLVMLGYACAAAHQAGDPLLFDRFLHLTNAVGRTSPHFVPYYVANQEPS